MFVCLFVSIGKIWWINMSWVFFLCPSCYVIRRPLVIVITLVDFAKDFDVAEMSLDLF